MAISITLTKGTTTYNLHDMDGLGQNIIMDKTLEIRETLYSGEFKPTLNTAKWEILYNAAVFSASQEEGWLVSIKEDGADLFTGYLRPANSMTYTHAPDRMPLEAVDTTVLIEGTYEGSTIISTAKKTPNPDGPWQAGDTLEEGYFVTKSNGTDSLVHFLVGKTRFGDAHQIQVPDRDYLLNIFRLDRGEDIQKQLAEILWGHGLVYRAQENGNLALYDWAVESPSPTFTFDGSNVIKKFSLKKKDRKTSGVTVGYSEFKRTETKAVCLSLSPQAEISHNRGGGEDRQYCWPPLRDQLGNVTDRSQFDIPGELLQAWQPPQVRGVRGEYAWSNIEVAISFEVSWEEAAFWTSDWESARTVITTLKLRAGEIPRTYTLRTFAQDQVRAFQQDALRAVVDWSISDDGFTIKLKGPEDWDQITTEDNDTVGSKYPRIRLKVTSIEAKGDLVYYYHGEKDANDETAPRVRTVTLTEGKSLIKEYIVQQLTSRSLADRLSKALDRGLSADLISFESTVKRPLGEIVSVTYAEKGFSGVGRIIGVAKKRSSSFWLYSYQIETTAPLILVEPLYTPDLRPRRDKFNLPMTQSEFETRILGKISPLNVALSNYAVGCFTSPDGSNPDLTSASTQVAVSLDGLDVSLSSDVIASPSSGVTGSFGTGDQSRVYSITSLEVSSGFVDFSVSYGGQVESVRFQIYKVIPGEKGDQGDPGLVYSYSPLTVVLKGTGQGRSAVLSWSKNPFNLALKRYRLQIEYSGSWYKFDPGYLGPLEGIDTWVPTEEGFYETTAETLIVRLPLAMDSNGIVSDRTWKFRIQQVSKTNSNDDTDFSGDFSEIEIIVRATQASDMAKNSVTQAMIDLDNWLDSQPIQQGLFAHWSFDDMIAPGAIVKDQSGNGRSSTISTDLQSDQGVSGKALKLGPTGRFVIPESMPGLSTDDSWSISLWVKFNADPSGTECLIAGQGSYGGSRGIWSTASHGLKFWLRTNEGSFHSYIISVAPVIGKWYHLCLSVDGSTRLAVGYVDGEIVWQTVLPSGHSWENAWFETNGLKQTEGTPTLGRKQFSLDELRLYSRALSDADVRYLYANPGGPVPAIFGAERIIAKSLTALEVAAKAITTAELMVAQVTNSKATLSTLDDLLNYWYLETGSKPEGAFRVGNGTTFISFDPNGNAEGTNRHFAIGGNVSIDGNVKIGSTDDTLTGYIGGQVAEAVSGERYQFPIDSGLEFHLSLDNVSTPEADNSVNARNFTKTGSPVAVAGVSSNGLRFSTTEQQNLSRNPATAPTITAPAEWTVSLWTKRIGDPNNIHPALVHNSTGDMTSGTGGRGFLIQSDVTVGSKLVRVRWNVAGTLRALTTPTEVLFSEWVHVAFTYKSGEQKLYINGQVVASSLFSDGTVPIPGNFTVGRWTSYDRRYNGDIDEVRYYSRVLSVEEVRGLYRIPNRTSTAESATSYWIVPDQTTIKRSGATTYDPTTATFYAKSKTGTQAEANFSGYWKFFTLTTGGSWTQQGGISALLSTYTSPALSGYSNLVQVRAELYKDAAGTTLLDSETAVVLVDGATTPVIDVDKDLTGLPCDEGGSLLSTPSIQVQASLYVGSADVSGSATWATVLSGVTLSAGANTRTVTVNNLTADIGTVKFTATYQGVAYVVYATFVKQYQGIEGPQGIQGPAGDTKFKYFQSTAPSSGMVTNDLWYDTANKQIKRYTGSAWEIPKVAQVNISGVLTADVLDVDSIVAKQAFISALTAKELKSANYDTVNLTGTRARFLLNSALLELERLASGASKFKLSLTPTGLVATHEGKTVFSVDSANGDVTFGDYTGGVGMRWIAATGLLTMLGCSLDVSNASVGPFQAKNIYPPSGFSPSGSYRGAEIIDSLTSLTGHSSGSVACKATVRHDVSAGVIEFLEASRISWTYSSVTFYGALTSVYQFNADPPAQRNTSMTISRTLNTVSSGYYPVIRSAYYSTVIDGRIITPTGLIQVANGATTHGAVWTALEALGWDIDSMHIAASEDTGDNYGESGTIMKKVVSGQNRYFLSIPGRYSSEFYSGRSDLFGFRLWVM